MESKTGVRYETSEVRTNLLFKYSNNLTNFLIRFRRRHVVEMISMAQRPFSNVILDSTMENASESQAQKTTKLKPLTSKKDANNICPIAIEMTSNNQAAVR